MNAVIAPNYTQREYTWTAFKAALTKKQLIIQFVEDDLTYKIWGYDGPEVHICVLFKSTIPEYITSITQVQNDLDKTDFETNYKSTANDKINTRVIEKLPEPQPFATPSYRTKRSATDELVSVAPGATENIDFVMPQERYVHGGKLVVGNAELGDSFKAQVVDASALIPAPYRAALCEAWPVVAEYIEKEWVDPSGKHEINTYPLNAKVTPGLVLRVVYTATNSGEARQVGINYFLTKKL